MVFWIEVSQPEASVDRHEWSSLALFPGWVNTSLEYKLS